MSRSHRLEKPKLSLGYIPLTDCAALVVASELGLFADQGLDVSLSKETSWSNIRDKLAIGVLDGAHMLAAMPLANTLGVGPIKKPTIAALSLGLNGNAITVSKALYQEMAELEPERIAERPCTAYPFKALLAKRRKANQPPPTLAVVYPFSTHNYQLRYWLAAAGIHPDQEVNLIAAAPAQMVSLLAEGKIDGYCVGEPWNELAVKEGVGKVLITSYEIWNNGPEKVFGVNAEWAAQHPRTHQALLKALLKAGQWLDAPENRPELVQMLAQSHYVNAPAEIIGMSLAGTFQYSKTEFPVSLPDFSVFHRYAANFPWRSHALWLLTQMARWGQLREPLDLHRVAENVYRPDLFRQAARELELATPVCDYKCEGFHRDAWHLAQAGEPLEMGPDCLLDGELFDPSDPVGYLTRMSIHSRSLSIEQIAACNMPWQPEQRIQWLAQERPRYRQAVA